MSSNSSLASITSIQGHLSFSNTAVTAWYRLPASQYEFINNSDKVMKANELTFALTSLVKNEEQAVECHILGNTRTFDAVSWYQNNTNRLKSYPNAPIPYSQYYYEKMRDHIADEEYEEKIVLLGVVIGKRSLYNPSMKEKESGFALLDKLVNYLGAAPVADYVTEDEVKFWMKRSSPITISLKHSRMRIPTATSSEIAFSLAKPFYPSIPFDQKNILNTGNTEGWGEGEIASLVEAQIENNPKFLKITQETAEGPKTGYRATLCFAKFPDIINYPESDPWIHYASYLPFGVDFSIRFSLMPARQVQKQAERMRKRHVDQGLNEANAGGNISQINMDQIQLGEDLNYVLERDKTPWFYGYHRLTVTGTTEEELRTNVTKVIDHYKSNDILLVWSTGDQMNLLKETLPSDKVRINSYFQRQELTIIGGGVPSGAGTVGDIDSTEQANIYRRLGPFIGETIGSTRMPVLFSLLNAAEAKNAPTTVIVGKSGSGKTHFALTALYQAVLDGAWAIMIDPKGQVGKMAKMQGIESKTTVLDVSQGQPGTLSPFLLSEDPAQQKELALETCIIFGGGRKAMNAKAITALVNAIEKAMSKPEPSLNRVVGILKADTIDEAQQLGKTLQFASELPLGRLCFPAGGQRVRTDAGLTIFQINGLKMPPAEKKPEDYRGEESLSLAIMYLLTSFTSSLLTSGMTHPDQPKILAIDEAWMLTATEQGSDLIEKFVRMGRSLKCSLNLITQSTAELNDTVASNTSTVFAFQTEGSKTIKSLYEFLELDPAEYSEDYVRQLDRGECLMKDASKRIAPMKVDTKWFPPAHNPIL